MRALWMVLFASSVACGGPAAEDAASSGSATNGNGGETIEPTSAIDPTDRTTERATPGNIPVDPSMLPAPSDVAAIPPNAAVTPSGLASRVLRAGSGTVHPTATSRVRVHYTGWTTDGRMFDSSRTRGEVAEFPLSGVIAGWTEGVQLMVVGEERRFWIPGSLAYGDAPRGRMPTGMLVFDVELIAIP